MSLISLDSLNLDCMAINRVGVILEITKSAQTWLKLQPKQNILNTPELVLVDENFNEISKNDIVIDNIFDSIDLGICVDNSSVQWVRLFFTFHKDFTLIRFEHIEELVAMRRLNQQLAIRDPHTGLLYRDAFITKLNESDLHGTMCCVRICNYQRISEIWNIGVANLVFMEILSRFQGEYEVGIFAKHSSDCFSVFIPEDIEFNIEAMYGVLNEPFNFNKHSFYSNVALGYYKEKPYDDHELSLNKAEIATFDVISEKLKLVEFQDALAKQLERQDQLETAFRCAINTPSSDSRFEVVFQPIHETKVEKVIGAECLMRWHFNGSSISPVEFIPIAESTGEISKLTLLSLKQIKAVSSKLEEQTERAQKLLFSINISVVEILDIDFEKHLLAEVQKLQLNPKFIKLELTETGLIDNFSFVNERLMRLREAGFTISIDDFGTGFSSLSYLCKLHFDEIKIDRSFVTNVIHDGKVQSIFNSIATLAKNLEKPVIAEGIETLEQMIYAKAKGIEYIQGFYYSKPMSQVDFVNYVLEDKSTYLQF